MKKKCVGCNKQIPSVALDCVFCKAKQPAAQEGDLYEAADRASLHATDVTMVGMRSYAELEKAAQEAKAAAAAVEEPKAQNGEASPSNGEAAHPAMPSQARLTAAMPAVSLPPEADAQAKASAAATANPAASKLLEDVPADEPQPSRGFAPPIEKPFLGLGRAVMGIGGAVMIALFFLPWHGVHSWRLLETMGGADFVRQLFYLTGGIVLLVSALLPLPFVFRASVGALVAATPVMLGAGGVLEGWRGVVAGLAIVALPATHLLRTQAKSSNAARALVAAAVAAVTVLYLIPVSSMVPIASVFKMIGTGQVGQVVVGVFVLIPLGFAFLSLLGLLGRDLTDVGVLLSVLILLWAPVVVALRGTMLGDMTQVYVALALLWASATSAVSLAQLLSLAARDATALIAGRSREGRPIEAECIGPPDGLAALLVFGAIHGDEPESAELCRRWVARLRLAAPRERVIVVPVANPDGLAALAKDNARGVDLNRNFPSRNWSPEHAARYFPGDAPLSEPESQALAALIEATRPRVLIAVHQPFRCVNWDGPAEALAGRMSAACGYPAVASVGYPTPGSFGSCYGVDAGRPVITLELPRAVGEDDYAGCLDALDCATIASP